LNGSDGAPSLQAPYPPPTTWAWMLNLDPLGTFRWGFLNILVALKQEMQLTFKFPLNYIAQNLSDVATWHLFLLFPHWCLLLPIRRGHVGHNEKVGLGYEGFFL
jgi:hypothetical protein